MNLARYRKAIVAVLGFAVIVVNEFAGLAIGLDEVQEIITVGTALGTAVGVWGFRNEEA